METIALSDRKQRILAAVIEAYIATGEPIGSKLLADALGHAVSSATIRNEMAELSAIGLLAQPHTSAGRVPTAPAFRLYIDRLMPHRELTLEHRREIDRLLLGAGNDPDRLVRDAADALAMMTGCAAVSTTPSEQGATVRRLEVMYISSRMAAVVLMTDAGSIRNRLCCFDRPVSAAALHAMAAELEERFGGHLLSDITLPAVQGMMLSFGTEGLSRMPVLTALLELAGEATEAQINLKGQLNLLQHPDYNAERVTTLLGFLARQELIGAMLSSCADGRRVLLGSESVRPELNGSSLIVARYRGGNGGEGSLGVIGPLRMDYATTIPRIEYLATSLSRHLGRLAQ